MNIFSSSDIDTLNDKSSLILAEAKKIENILLEPTIILTKKIKTDILEYCIKKKRKLYGGYALNQLIIDKNPDDAIYNDLDRPDIDIYSPTPIDDLRELCDLLNKKGYKRVVGKEAVHEGTYVIFVEYEEQCNFTYVPKIIYDRIPFKEINNLYITHPIWVMIDYFRIFTDPVMSFRLLTKAFGRFFLLQKHYPFPINNKIINFEKQQSLQDIFDKVYEFIINNNVGILIGFCAYNYFVNVSDIKEYLIDPPYIEIILPNYEQDGKKLLNLLQKYFDKITIQEYYPFFQFYGYNSVIKQNNIPVVYIYNNNERCVPYIKVPYEKNNSHFLLIGSFDTQILYFLIFIMKKRINKEVNDIYFTLINNMLKMRNEYLLRTNKTIFDDSIFQGFITSCYGNPLNPKRKKRLLIEYRRKNKLRIEYLYDPTIGGSRPNFKFPNISGNEIRNKKNERIGKEHVDIIEDEPDELDVSNEDNDIIIETNKDITKDKYNKDNKSNNDESFFT